MTWRERIQAARARGAFTHDERRLADDWGTCAVGECGRMLPRSSSTNSRFTALSYMPARVPEFIYIGTEFLHAVNRNDFDAAEDLLDAIEDRALELKRGLSAPKTTLQ